VGAEPLAVTDNLNFGSPEKPIGYWQLASACKGLSEGCKELGTPVTGGNVSLYNETFDAQGNPQPIYPTPVVGMVGLIEDLDKICGQGWQNEGDLIYLLGLPTQSKIQNPKSKIELGASEYLATIHNTIAGRPPRVDFDLERKVQSVCRHGIRSGWVRSAHDTAEGGLTVALAECCLGGKLGAEVNLGISANYQNRFDEVLFGEGGARILVSVSQENQEIWESYLQEHLGENWQNLGIVANVEAGLTVNTADNQEVMKVSISDMSNVYDQAIAQRLALYANT
jgi:phosphoribosylformylglycinamidine synthase